MSGTHVSGIDLTSRFGGAARSRGFTRTFTSGRAPCPNCSAFMLRSNPCQIAVKCGSGIKAAHHEGENDRKMVRIIVGYTPGGAHFSNGQEVTRIVESMLNGPTETLAKLKQVLK